MSRAEIEDLKREGRSLFGRRLLVPGHVFSTPEIDYPAVVRGIHPSPGAHEFPLRPLPFVILPAYQPNLNASLPAQSRPFIPRRPRPALPPPT